ncbi:MAG: T9SS type A sorting domain-containing protein [Bacteroidota bacterium]
MFTSLFSRVVFLALFGSFSCLVYAGQNSGAGIRFDLNSSTSGNQNQITISCPGTNSFFRIDIYVVNASNLDTYEFNINYNTADLQFIGGAEDQPVTFESNFLKGNGGSTTGFTCTAASGVVNCANSLVGNQGDSTPDGEGLLASIVFKALVDCPSNLSFGDVDWYDNNGVLDVCTDKGGNAALPVELSSFTARVTNTEVLLKWTTATEVENYGFDIERSVKNNKSNQEFIWETIGFVEGHGNSNSPKEYSFTDKNPAGGSKFLYRLKQIDTGGKFEYSDVVEVELIPTEFVLYQNYPNPFNPTTQLSYQIPKDGFVNLVVYNTLGQEVAKLVNQHQLSGKYSVQFNASDLPSGIYLYKIASGSFSKVNKMLLLR